MYSQRSPVYSLGSGSGCPDGQEEVSNACVDCNAGYYDKEKVCTVCAYDTYQPLAAQTSCTACTDSKQTTETASTSANDCKEICVMPTLTNMQYTVNNIAKTAGYRYRNLPFIDEKPAIFFLRQFLLSTFLFDMAKTNCLTARFGVGSAVSLLCTTDYTNSNLQTQAFTCSTSNKGSMPTECYCKYITLRTTKHSLTKAVFLIQPILPPPPRGVIGETTVPSLIIITKSLF